MSESSKGCSVSKVFSGLVHVDYGQAYLQSRYDIIRDTADCFAGQVNGICGAACRGWAWFFTASQGGVAAFTVELLAQVPDRDEHYEDVVEVSFTPVGRAVSLVGLNAGPVTTFNLNAETYRLRYSTRGTDAARAPYSMEVDPDVRPDEYLVQLWPEPWRRDAIMVQASEWATYAHRSRAGHSARLSETTWDVLEQVSTPMMNEVCLWAAGQFLQMVGLGDDPRSSSLLGEISASLRGATVQLPSLTTLSEGVGEAQRAAGSLDASSPEGIAAMSRLQGWLVLRSLVLWCADPAKSNDVAIGQVLWPIAGTHPQEWLALEEEIRNMISAQSN